MTKIKYVDLFIQMKRNGDTQKSIAKAIGISQQSISNKLAGKSEWTKSEIDNICKHYNKTYEELFKEYE